MQEPTDIIKLDDHVDVAGIIRPFQSAKLERYPVGMSVQDIMDDMQPFANMLPHTHLMLDGVPVPRGEWPMTFPQVF